MGTYKGSGSGFLVFEASNLVAEDEREGEALGGIAGLAGVPLGELLAAAWVA